MSRVWADTLFRAEQQHALGLLVWAAGSIVAGTALMTTMTLRRMSSPLLRQFAFQMIGWGLVEVLLGALAWRGLVVRDLAGATRLERKLWLEAGLEMGVVAVGATVAATTWFGPRKPGGLGAGIGIVVQGLAMLVLDLWFVAILAR